MILRTFIAGLLLSALITLPCAAQDAPGTLRVLCYHDIRDAFASTRAERPDPEATDTSDLVAQFSWLHDRGYVSVTLDQVLAARSGGPALPAKAILLTFDDGYRSLYTKVFPLLRVFGFHAVAGLVTSWMEVPADGRVAYGEQGLPRDAFVTWDQVREMEASGLIEVASHTDDLHHGLFANPQGAMLPAAVARRYDPASAAYETESQYRARLQEDLARSRIILQERLHRAPRAVIWPYGEYNAIAAETAIGLGMPIGFNLELGDNEPGRALQALRRTQLQSTTTIADLIVALRRTPGPRAEDLGPERVMHIDLDYVYDPDPAQQERNLDHLIERVADLRPSTVYLQAFADPNGKGAAEALYFPNRHLPMRADLFSRVAWQLRTRARVRVYAWMPLLAFRLPPGEAASHPLVAATRDAPSGAGAYARLTPFHAGNRALIREIYQDLARSTRFAGLLFHDDATLAGNEDVSADAVDYARREWQLSLDPAHDLTLPAARTAWAQRKSAFLDQFTLELADLVRQEQPALLTARNLYAPTVTDPDAGTRFAQDYAHALQIYDYTAVMAMPYMEAASAPLPWLSTLVEAATRQPDALARTVFELQAQDWHTHTPVPAQVLVTQMQHLKVLGARNLGYYPDDFLHDHPDAQILKPVFSLERLYRGH